MYYYYSILKVENVRCVVAIDYEYEAVQQWPKIPSILHMYIKQDARHVRSDH